MKKNWNRIVIELRESAVLARCSFKIHFKCTSSRISSGYLQATKRKIRSESEYNRGNHVAAIVDDLAGFDGTIDEATDERTRQIDPRARQHRSSAYFTTEDRSMRNLAIDPPSR